MAYEVHDGHQKFHDVESRILEPEDWATHEWATICKLCGLPLGQTERIVLHADEMECCVDLSKKVVDNERTYIVTEVCPHCESEVEMRWNTDTMAFCPVCGNRLMLCDECRYTEEPTPCDYDSHTDTCHRNPKKEAPAEDLPSLRVETPLGAIIARINTDPDYPDIWLDLRRPDVDQDMPLVMVEFCRDGGDQPEDQPNIITRVWADGGQEDCTTRIVHRGVEEYFKIEED